MEGIAVWNLKPERWGSALVQEEKYQGEKACDKRHQQPQQNSSNNNNNNNAMKRYLDCFESSIKFRPSVAFEVLPSFFILPFSSTEVYLVYNLDPFLLNFRSNMFYNLLWFQ